MKLIIKLHKIKIIENTQNDSKTINSPSEIPNLDNNTKNNTQYDQQTENKEEIENAN